MWLNKKVIVLLCALLSSTVALSENTAQDATAVAEFTESQQMANDLLLNMATQLGTAERFQVDMRIGYDVLQANGQKIEFGEQRRLYVERPSLLLSDVQNSDGAGEAILFDGKWITVSNMGAKVYARAPQPGDIDNTLMYFLNVLHMRLPLAAMLMSRFPEILEKRLVDIDYVEETNILGEPADHIAGRTKDVDFQVWISKGNQNLPLRIILTYREATGQPQFWANFSKWNLRPSFLQKTFRFEPPPGAREVPLVASFTAHAASGAGAANPAPSSAGDKP
jgi:hypothetical protein